MKRVVSGSWGRRVRSFHKTRPPGATPLTAPLTWLSSHFSPFPPLPSTSFHFSPIFHTFLSFSASKIQLAPGCSRE